MMHKKKCIFFDRDGTLIDIPNHKSLKPKSFNNLNQVHLRKEVIEVCSFLKKKYLLMLLLINQTLQEEKTPKINVENINLFLKKETLS